MKRQLTTLLLLLMAVAGMQAQKLQGKWMSKVNEDGQEITMYLTFDEKFLLKAQIVGDVPNLGQLYMSFTVPGTYRQSGEDLHIDIDKTKSEAAIDKIVFTEEAQKLVNEKPEVKDQLLEALKPALVEARDSFMKEFPLDGELTIYELTDTTLRFDEPDVDEADIPSFTRVE